MGYLSIICVPTMDTDGCCGLLATAPTSWVPSSDLWMFTRGGYGPGFGTFGWMVFSGGALEQFFGYRDFRFSCVLWLLVGRSFWGVVTRAGSGIIWCRHWCLLRLAGVLDLLIKAARSFSKSKRLDGVFQMGPA